MLLKKQNEIIGLQKEYQMIIKDNAKLTSILDKLEREGEDLQKKSKDIVEKMNKTQAKNFLLNKACETTEKEIKEL